MSGAPAGEMKTEAAGDGLPRAARAPRPGLSGRWLTLVASAILVIAGTTVYLNSFSGQFFFDDNGSIRHNPDLHKAWPPWRILVSPSFAARPIAGLTLALNYHADGLNVRGYHGVNLAIHLIAALALFGVVRRTLRTGRLRPRFGHAADALALAVALVWVVHPLNTQSVTYIIQRCTSLMVMFYLLMIYAILRGTTSRRPTPWYTAAVLACALGLGTKQAMVTAPAVALLLDRTFLAGSFREAWRRRWRLYLGLVATWAMLIPYFWERSTLPPENPIPTAWEYFRSEFGVVTHYLWLAIAPTPLCLDYAWPVARTVSEILPPALFIVALAGLATWALLRRPRSAAGEAVRAAGFAGCAFFIVLSPTSSFVPIEDLAFEQRMYMPLIFIVCLLMGGGYALARVLVARLVRTASRRRLVLGGAAAVAVACVALPLGYLTVERNMLYESSLALWGDTAAKRPGNARAHSNLGVTLYRAGQLQRALEEFTRALELDPNLDEAHQNRGAIYQRRGQLDLAIADFTRAIEINPAYSNAYNNRGNAHQARGDYRTAIADYTRAIEIRPDFIMAYNNRGLARLRLGMPELAIWNFCRAIDLSPDFATAYNNLGNAYHLTGDYEAAVSNYNKAISLKPGVASAYQCRAISYFKLRQYDKAWEDVRQCRKLGHPVDTELIKELKQATGIAE